MLRALDRRGQVKIWAAVLYMLLVVAIIFGSLIVFEMTGIGDPGLVHPALP